MITMRLYCVAFHHTGVSIFFNHSVYVDHGLHGLQHTLSSSNKSDKIQISEHLCVKPEELVNRRWMHCLQKVDVSFCSAVA